MWTMLAGVPGKLTALLDRLTSTRATNLDRLDTTITSRAQQSTALSNAVWTNGRAASLDSAVLTSVVKSVQRGNVSNRSGSPHPGITLSTEVNVSKCVVIIMYYQSQNDLGGDCKYTLSSTELTVSAPSYYSAVSHYMGFAWQVIEFN